MINTYSLRIGNIVQYDDGTEVQVCGIKQLDILVSGFSQYTSVNCFNGIELSPDWLERLGFAHVDGWQDTWWFKSFIGVNLHLGKLYYNNLSNHVELKSVHHLMNLYQSLTGEELITGEKEGV